MAIQHRLFGILGSPSRRLLAMNLVLLTGGEMLSRVLTALAFIYLARILNPTSYGTVELTLAVMMFATLAVDQGLGTIGTRDVARDYSKSKSNSLLHRVVSTQLLLALAVLLAIISIGYLLPIDSTIVLLLAGFGISLLGYPLIVFWVFQARNQMLWVALPQVLRQATFAILVLLLVSSPEQLLRIPLAEIAGVMVAAVVSLLALRRYGDHLKIGLRTGWDRRLLAESLPIGGAQMIWALRMYLPIIIIGIITGQAAAAFFAVAHRIMMVSQTLLEAYFRNIFPSLSQAAADSTERLASLLRRSMMLLILPLLALAVAVTLGASNILSFVFGEIYALSESANVLALLIWTIPILGWRRHSRNALIVLGRQRDELVLSLIGVSLLIGLAIPLTIRLGIFGTALAIVLSELIIASVAWWRVKKLLASRHEEVLSGHPSALGQDIERVPVQTRASSEDLPLNRPDPIFIVGAPRSGTSLLRVMLNRHPGIGICDETHFFYYVYARRKAFGDLGDSELRRRLVDRYLSTHRIRRIGFHLDSLADVLMREGDRYDSFFLALLRFYATEREKRRYGEKTPHHALYAELLCKWFPGCKLIHVVRDPRDVVSSLLQMPWAGKSVTANARSWMKYTRGADRVIDLSNNYLLAQYERIVSEPETELRRICAFLGEEYSSEMLAPGDSPEAQVVSNEWWFRRATQPVTKDRIGRWRRELTPKQIALTEWVVGPYLQQFGYVPSGETASVSTKTVALIDEAIVGLHQRFTKARRLWYYWVRRTEIAKEEAIIDAN